MGDRLGERDGKTQRVSDGKTEKEVSAMLEWYDMGLSDGDDERSPPKLEIASAYKSILLSPTFYPPPPPPHAMDISSVRFRYGSGHCPLPYRNVMCHHWHRLR